MKTDHDPERNLSTETNPGRASAALHDTHGASMAKAIDLVADVGESFGAYEIGDDDALLGILTSANVACGFHAGDPQVMQRTITACLSHGVSIGAHPGFADLRGFGRRPIAMSTAEVRTDTLYQLGALQALTQAQGSSISHVTPHGSLGNLSVSDPAYARGVLEAVQQFDPSLPVVTQEGELARLAREEGVPVAITAMADRAYNADGSLVSRSEPGAVINDEEHIVDRVLRMVSTGTVEAADGSIVELDVATVLLHGDNPSALALARRVRAALVEDGIRLAPLSTVLGLSQLDELATP